ncbi:acyl-CoA dehydratase activase [Halothermothrix orenii]|uniref:Putative CoA-substrate-specific enzyme activase n=1 Tax=Halothermothrix orenii (strain H 168 / OCM 544 / DSM 9562) TaxID=373903 RepID=B8CVZ9_HALOH|nr:acyl-CoA dehydratase activase [Halothermothrix orenii]ACL69468.1 putative CoA-substrate-specific enzyme activase [Halothermothrix orenii H 168]
MGKYYLGVDVGSVSTDMALIDPFGNLIEKIYLRTKGQPIEVIKRGLKKLKENYGSIKVAGVGTTGSGRKLAGVMLGADVIKNEITAHAVAATHLVPDARTVLEIGGQDSKIIILKDGIAVDFAMNTVCAAGTGSFLDQQAARLGISIGEFSRLALKARSPVRIAGRCSVFAESDMIHKQQLGHDLPEIVAGLCEAMVRNYLNNVAKGKDIKPPVVFQGGVAANIGIKKAFEKELHTEIYVPEHNGVMGAIGAALLAMEEVRSRKKETSFKGFEVTEFKFKTTSFECKGCPNRCEIVNINQDGKTIARWGSKCLKWDMTEDKKKEEVNLNPS